MQQEIEDLRKKIDEIDTAILAYLKKRKEIVLKIGEAKRKTGREVHDPERENNILQKAETGYESEVMKTIMSESKKLQAGFDSEGKN